MMQLIITRDNHHILVSPSVQGLGRRVTTVSFFTNKLVQQYREKWEDEMDLVVKDLYRDEKASVERVVIRRRLLLMQYNILYRMMFDTRFESMEDPLLKQITPLNTEMTMLAKQFLRGYLERCRELQSKRLIFFNKYLHKKKISL